MSAVTISVIKADVGGYVGHSAVHPELLAEAERRVREAVGDGLLIDGAVNTCDDDVNLVMTHRRGVDAVPVHRFAWEAFEAMTEVARRLHLYGAGQDLLADAFSGNVRGAGPEAAELEISERPSEPFIVFAADKCAPGAWNLPLYAIFCDPFNTAGLIIDTTMHRGFTVEVHDLIEHRRIFFDCPEDLYDLAGWMRGSHNGPLMPCAITDSHPARFDGPPRVVGMGFQLADGRLIGPRDMLGDISFDRARQQALELADHLRRMGPFEPGRLPMEDMEYTTMPAVAERVAERWEPIEEPAPAPA